MKQPLHKRALSYLKEVHIESTDSDYNEVLDVFLVKDRYQLCTENAIYSYADKYDNFANVFKELIFENISDVLILGLGLASIPWMLEHSFGKKLSYTGVEIDEEPIYLASKYVLDEIKSDIDVLNTDAYTFVAITESRYDLICMDVFIDDKVPEELETEEFAEMLSQTLADDGILVFNRLAFTEEDKKSTSDYFENVFKKIFPKATIFESGGNRMLLSRPLK
jgi:spermidine synthase